MTPLVLVDFETDTGFVVLPWLCKSNLPNVLDVFKPLNVIMTHSKLKHPYIVSQEPQYARFYRMLTCLPIV